MWGIQRTSYLILFLCLPFFIKAQVCELALSGYVLDKGTEIPLAFANVFLEDQQVGAVSDSLGFFQFKNLCPGDYHLSISHIGCEQEVQFVKLEQNTKITILMHHHAELLDEVLVHGSRDDNTAQVSSTVSRQEIEQNSYKNLSDILEGISGVSVLKNGTGISKPVVHGLYGNRVAILNNGIEQSGQQWGNDHAPEIDPFFANHLSVVKGASALAYGSNALGSVVLVETDPVKKDPHLHGCFNYTFQSNGLGHTLNTQLEKNSPWAAWRISGTLKLQGDSNSPDYFLTNTGKREGNIALHVEKKFNERWHNKLYLSSFNTKIGVLRGSHISNLTDLYAALESSEPFFTKDAFSYAINAPRQRVGHHLLKVESKYFLNDRQVLNFKYGGQLNNRKEFDIRRGGRSSRPSLSLEQYSHFTELKLDQTFLGGVLLKTGLQYKFVDNSNNPETGVSPLIPKYDAHTNSAFLIVQKEKGKSFYELGGRYDLKNLKVITVSDNMPRTIERLRHTFHNYALSAGLKHRVNESLKLNLNAGYMLRAPEINELYSFGLHQGVSGIEEGNRSLQSEKSFKGIVSLDWYFKKKFFVQALGYYHHIQDYIYLQPQQEFRLTIRGAFPVFIYEQTDARIQGLDLLCSFEPTESTKWLFKYAHINARDLENNLELINIPSDNLFSSFTFSMKDLERFKQNTLSVNGKYVFKRQDILEEQDFLATPDAYFLLGLNIGTQWQFSDTSLRISLSVDNVLNQSYRDYLNRLRYFADETGRNIVLNLKYGF